MTNVIHCKKDNPEIVYPEIVFLTGAFADTFIMISSSTATTLARICTIIELKTAVFDIAIGRVVLRIAPCRS